MIVELHSKLLSRELVKDIENGFNSKFLLDSEYKMGSGLYSPPMSYFYSEKKHPDSGSHYFCIHWNDGWCISNGNSVLSLNIEALLIDDKEVVYSSYNHDYSSSNLINIAIDGGRAYTRTVGDLTNPRIKHGTLLVVDDKVIFQSNDEVQSILK